MMAAETNPQWVWFELDPFWVHLAGRDPLQLLKAYGSRIALLHVKDMKNGTRTGVLTGHSEAESDAALGDGCMAWPEILSAAQDAGVRWYIVEDESPSFFDHISRSLRYLEHLR
jgi:sugar phosphate isomerase/epimerase